MTFTKEQRESIERNGSVAVNIDGIECVVLRADIYDQVRGMFTDDVTDDELRAMLARSAECSDWLDPSMDIYDDYEKHR